MMGITQSYGHLFPEVRTEQDLDNIFGKYDQLDMDDQDRKK